jgi:hypothetical protein
MKIDKPYNYNNDFFRRSTFAFTPRTIKITNIFFPGMPTDFLQYKNRHPEDKRPEVLV